MKKKSFLIVMMLIITLIPCVFSVVKAATDSEIFYFNAAGLSKSYMYGSTSDITGGAVATITPGKYSFASNVYYGGSYAYVTENGTQIAYANGSSSGLSGTFEAVAGRRYEVWFMNPNTTYWYIINCAAATPADTTGPNHGYWLDENTRYTNGTSMRVHAQGATDAGSGVDAMYVWVSANGGTSWNVLSQARMIEWDNNGTRAWYYDVPLSAEGTYIVHTCPVDNAGNWTYGGPNEYIIVDRTGPRTWLLA